MGLTIAKTKDLWSRQVFSVKSTPANYVVAANVPFLTVSKGPVLILSIVECADTIIAAGTDTRIFIGALNMDAAVGLIAAAAAGMTCVSPLVVTVAKAVMALNSPVPSILGFPLPYAVVATPGQVINVSFGTANMGAGELYSLLVTYRKLTPLAFIS